MSAKRLRDFLKNEELDEDSVTRDSAAGMNISYCISSRGSDWHGRQEESRCKWSNSPSIRSPVVDTEMLRSGHWLWSVFCVSFDALTLVVG